MPRPGSIPRDIPAAEGTSLETELAPFQGTTPERGSGSGFARALWFFNREKSSEKCPVMAPRYCWCGRPWRAGGDVPTALQVAAEPWDKSFWPLLQPAAARRGCFYALQKPAAARRGRFYALQQPAAARRGRFYALQQPAAARPGRFYALQQPAAAWSPCKSALLQPAEARDASFYLLQVCAESGDLVQSGS